MQNMLLKEQYDLWNVTNETSIPLLEEPVKCQDKMRKVTTFLPSILYPQLKLIRTLEKKFSKQCKISFENEMLVVDDGFMKRSFCYVDDKKSLLLMSSEVMKETTRIKEAEEKEIRLTDPRPDMKMTVKTKNELVKALKDVQSVFFIYDVQKILEAIGIPMPFRLEWKETDEFYVLKEISNTERAIMAVICFPNDTDIQVTTKEVARYYVQNENGVATLKKR